MTDREKLIELLLQDTCPDDGCDFCPYADSEHCRAECTSDHLFANGVTFQKWIPVTERLPEHDGRYICNVKSFAFPGTFYQKELLFERGDWLGLNIVTHWMPMPEPPQEEHNGKE